jgi:hypothetical protein
VAEAVGVASEVLAVECLAEVEPAAVGNVMIAKQVRLSHRGRAALQGRVRRLISRRALAPVVALEKEVACFLKTKFKNS